MKNGGGLKEVRFEARAQNNVLWRAIHESSPSVKKFAETAGLKGVLTTIYGYLNLSISPYSKKGELTDTAQKLADALGISPRDLFPAGLYSAGKNRWVKELSLSELAPEERQQALAYSESLTPYDHLVEEEKRRVLLQVLETLTPRERMIISLHFGMDELGPLSIPEIAEHLNSTKWWIKTLIKMAMRKLRKPDRAGKLRVFIRGGKN